MIVTMEQLEKGLWCPHVRARAIGGTRDQVANRVVEAKEIKADGKKIFCCIGPACMAWRWYEKNEAGFCGLAGNTTPAEVDDKPFRVQPGKVAPDGRPPADPDLDDYAGGKKKK